MKTITVKELIEELKKCDGEDVLFKYDIDRYVAIEKVELDGEDVVLV
ncbi:MAG: hypothetical protein N4A63_08200 [Vallitalea sp.]|jgi:hypothetical protein|nr:hypothetical protein [Vallitalea sp.]